MILRTSFGEFGHCTECNRDFDSEELWEDEIEICPKCNTPLYGKDNPNKSIPEEIELL